MGLTGMGSTDSASSAGPPVGPPMVPPAIGGHVQLFSQTAGAPVQWRLLSANNRDIGRGVDTYPDAESCRLGVKVLQSLVDELEGSVRRTSSHEWVWQLKHAGRPVALSGRGFDRLIRCEQGLAQFLFSLSRAQIGATLMVSHARRW